MIGAWIWHLGYQDPPWQLDDPAFWAHLALEGMVALGIGGSLFVLSGAALRYVEARRAPEQLSVDSPEHTQ